MKASSLHDVWAYPDDTRLTPKQYSFRLSIHVAAMVAALCGLYPQKSRTQIITDLLTSALDDLEKTFLRHRVILSMKNGTMRSLGKLEKMGNTCSISVAFEGDFINSLTRTTLNSKPNFEIHNRRDFSRMW